MTYEVTRDLPTETIGTRYGGIPQGLPPFELPAFSWETVKLLVVPTVTLALLGAITLVLFAYIGWLSWEWVQRDDVRIELSATTQLPRWYNYSAVPLALALLVWHQFVAILRDLHVVVKGAAQ